MPSSVVLLRGINLGATNRLAMPALREELSRAGFENVRTHAQSGNVILDTKLEGDALARAVGELIATRFGLDVPVVTRSARELEQVIAANPYPQAVELGPTRLQVTFFSAALSGAPATRLRGLSDAPFSPDTESISLAATRREAYGWHPAGIHASKLARELSDRRLGVAATARNWDTVTTLLDMATTNAD
jgi:uncharacterized protein (DUF1697 family)